MLAVALSPIKIQVLSGNTATIRLTIDLSDRDDMLPPHHLQLEIDLHKHWDRPKLPLHLAIMATSIRQQRGLVVAFAAATAARQATGNPTMLMIEIVR